MKIFSKYIIIVGIMMGLGLLMLANPAHASNQQTVDQLNKSMYTQMDAFGKQFGADVNTTPDIRVVVSRIIGIILSIMAILTTVYIIYGGYMYMTSGGNDERVGKSRKIIFYGALGLFIMLMSYSITAFVYNTVRKGTTGDNAFEWNMWSEPDNSQYNNPDTIDTNTVPDDYNVDWSVLDYSN